MKRPPGHLSPEGGIRASVTSILLVAAILPAGCHQGKRGATVLHPLDFRKRTLDYTGPEADDPEPAGVTEILIGWFGPSDPKHELGGGMWLAASLAVERANREGGYRGRPFRLLPHWSENPWTGGVGPLFRMVYEKHPWAILGGIDGTSTHLAEQVVAKALLPLVSPVSTDKSVNLAGVPWMFSCAPDDGQIAPRLVDGILRELKGTTDSLVLFNATDHDSRATSKEILKLLSDRKRLPQLHLECAPGAADLGPQLRALAETKPELVLIVANPIDSARLVTAVRDLKLDCRLFGTHHLGHSAFLRRAGADAEGVCFPLLYQPDGAGRRNRHFVEEFTAHHVSPPDYTAAYAYDATSLLIAAIRRGGLNRARIRKALVELSGWKGVTGRLRWDGTGQAQRKPLGLGVVRDGKVVCGPVGLAGAAERAAEARHLAPEVRRGANGWQTDTTDGENFPQTIRGPVSVFCGGGPGGS